MARAKKRDPLEMTPAERYRATETEGQAQRTVAAWLDAHKILWCHVPNGGSRGKAEAGRLKAHGVKAGVPDILVFDRSVHPVSHGTTSGVALELKRGSGGIVSPEQRRWLLDLEGRGWVALVAHGSGEAIAQLEALGYGGSR